MHIVYLMFLIPIGFFAFDWCVFYKISNIRQILDAGGKAAKYSVYDLYNIFVLSGLFALLLLKHFAHFEHDIFYLWSAALLCVVYCFGKFQKFLKT